ncbi:hybrid sensor histidine kinase/response regulator [bacterium]|nr:hybrid sensor histidine kinase/response regulator [bacterium]
MIVSNEEHSNSYSAMILAVDDRPDNLFVIEQLIRDSFKNIEIRTTTEPEEGLLLASQFQPDGILLDVQMPGMDGLEMCRKLKANPITAFIPIMLMTSHTADPKLKAAGLGAGAQDFMARPIDSVELTARINVMLRVKQAEDNLRDLNSRLLQEIKNHQKTEENLLKAKKTADAAVQSKTNLLSVTSHEIRNVIHHILSFSKFGIVKTDNAPKEKLLDYFTSIYKSANDLLTLVNDLLDHSKMETGKMTYRLLEVDLIHTAHNLVTEFNSVLKEKEISIEIIPPESMPLFYCDEFRIEQVMRNLLSNAVKFTPKGKNICLCFNNSPKAEDQPSTSEFQFSVINQGESIPEKELESIFGAYNQSSNKSVKGGTGLGLAISQEIVKAHGGKIWAENNPEGGAIFNFTLPFQLKPY